MPPRALKPSGLVLVDKPAGPSSFAVVKRLRDRTGARAGHAGTLDPFATGLLLVLLGASTRLAQYLVGLDKRYLTEIDLRAAHDDRRRRGRGRGAARGARRAGGTPGRPSRRDRAPGSGRLGGEDRGRARLPARPAGRRGRDAAAPLHRARARARVVRRTAWRRSTCASRSGTYVRAIAEALGGHCVSLRRTEVGPVLGRGRRRVQDRAARGCALVPSRRTRSTRRVRGRSDRAGGASTSACASSAPASSSRSTGRCCREGRRLARRSSERASARSRSEPSTACTAATSG